MHALMLGLTGVPYRFFLIPVRQSGPAEEELNRFLRSHRVLNVDRPWVDEGSESFWSFCVDYLETWQDGRAAQGGASERGRVDYRDSRIQGRSSATRSLDPLEVPQSFNSHPFSLVICFDNITPRAHKFLAGKRHSSTLRSCAALEPNLSESREIRFFRRSLPAAKVSTQQARKRMPTRMRARGTGQWWRILARYTMEFPVRQRQPSIWPWSRRFAPQ